MHFCVGCVTLGVQHAQESFLQQADRPSRKIRPRDGEFDGPVRPTRACIFVRGPAMKFGVHGCRDLSFNLLSSFPEKFGQAMRNLADLCGQMPRLYPDALCPDDAQNARAQVSLWQQGAQAPQQLRRRDG